MSTYSFKTPTPEKEKKTERRKMVSRLLTDRKGPRYRHSASCQSTVAGSLSPGKSLL